MSTKIANIETHPYNIGSLAGKYALADLSNSGAFTNVITSLPDRYRVIQNNSTITLKRGSVITIPNGFSEQGTHYNTYLYITKDLSFDIPSDFTPTEIENPEDTPANNLYLVYDREDNRLRYAYSNSYVGGLIKGIKFDFEQNYITSYDNHRLSLPLGYINMRTRLFHKFSSIGFYDDITWVDKGISYSIPSGRTSETKLKTYDINVNEVVFTQLTEAPCLNNVLLLDSSSNFSITPKIVYTNTTGTFKGNYLVYVSDDNYLYDSAKNIINKCRVARITIEAVNTTVKGHPVIMNLVKSIEHFNLYKLANYDDIQESTDSILTEAFLSLKKQLDTETASIQK